MIPEILFISHDASNTGAPYSLLSLIECLIRQGAVRPAIVLAQGGPREEAFRRLGPVFNVDTGDGPVGRTFLSLARGTSWRLHQRLSHIGLRRFVRGRDVSLIYSNTITNGRLLAALSEHRLPVITHVRELWSMIKECEENGSLAHTLRLTSQFIAVSEAVKSDLMTHCHVPAGKIDVVRNFLPLDQRKEIREDLARANVRRALGLLPDDVLIVGCGTTRPIKGPDLFIDVAAQVNAKMAGGRPVNFVWVGGEKSGPEYAGLATQIAGRGVSHCVHFLGYRADYLEFLAAADLFIMCSREDPAPLVVFEAASVGVPSIGFLDAGGAPEFIRDDAGVCVPKGNTEMMADAVVRIMDSPALRRRMASCARDRVHREHVASVSATRVLEILANTLLRADSGDSNDFRRVSAHR